MKRVLFIAYHFPPILGSSGYLRTLKFIRYLPEHGFEPVVLTVRPSAYPSWNDAQLSQVPPGVEVHRAFALDAQRHLSVRGRYLQVTSVPDRFSTWIPSGLLAGARIVLRKKIDILFSTYPIPSAHVIGGALARLTGKPWVADFRDPMWDEADYKPSPAMRARRAIEAMAVKRCSRALVCTEGVASLFRKRYGDRAGAKVSVIPNGYDENDFKGLSLPPREPGAPVTFIHAGLLERVDRDPVPFFRAVELALRTGRVRPGGMSVKLLGTGNNDLYREELRNLGLEDVIHLLPPKPYRQALEEMAASDVLLLFQGPGCDPQIPAKFYEYLRIGRPILAITTFTGNSGQSVLDTGSGRVVQWDDVEAMADVLGEWTAKVEKGLSLPAGDPVRAEPFSRQNHAGKLARLLASLDPRS